MRPSKPPYLPVQTITPAAAGVNLGYSLWNRVTLLLAVVILIIMGAGIPAGLVILAWGPSVSLKLLPIPIAIAIYTSWQLFRELLRREPNQMLMFFYAFTYVSFGTSPIPQLMADRFPWKGTYGMGEIIVAYLFVFAGLASFEWVNWFLRRRWSGRVGASQQTDGVRIPPTGVAVCLGLILISVILLYVSGWHKVMFQSRMDAVSEIYGQFGAESFYQLITRSMQGFSLVGAITLFLAAWGDRSHKMIWKWSFRILSIPLLVYALTIANPISTARAWSATTVIAIAGVVVHVTWPYLQRYFGVATAVGYLFIFPLADVYRSQYDLNTFHQSQMYSVTSNIKETFFTGDFDSFQQIMNARAAIEAEGYQFGRQLSGTLLFWFPRSLWLEKPLNSGDWVAIGVGYVYTNLSCPLWAEGLVDYGLVGTLGYLAIFAWVVNVLHYKAHSVSPSAVYYQIAVLILAPYSIYILRGGLLSCFAYITPVLLSIAVFLVVRRAFGSGSPFMTPMKAKALCVVSK